MNVTLQYLLADNHWSNWIDAQISVNTQNQVVIVNTQTQQTLEENFYRVLEMNNSKQPLVYWFVIENGSLYKITKSTTGFIEKATPVFDKNAKIIPVAKLAHDCSKKAYDEMLESAEDYLLPPLLTLETLHHLIMRTADAPQTMQLINFDTPSHFATNWWNSLYEKYRSHIENELVAILKNAPTRKQQILAFQNFLNDHYKFIGGTCLDYLAIPEHPVTLTLTYIAELLESELKVSAIEIMMPGIATESYRNNQPNLTEISPSQIFKTHHYLAPGFLIPVNSLLEYVQDSKTYIFSSYFQKDMSFYAVSKNDIELMFKHSPATLELRDAFLTAENLQTQKNNLLGQLNLLYKKLKQNSSNARFDYEFSAGGGAYSAIMDFMKFYVQLEDCSLIIKESEPLVSDLPENQNIGYVYYDHQLYFINRYVDSIKKITEIQQPSKFKIFLGRFQHINDVPKNMDMPAIIKTDDNQFTFFPTNKPLNPEVLKKFNNLFDIEYQHIICLSETNIPDNIFNEIIETGYHAPLFTQVFDERFNQTSKLLTSDDLAWINTHTSHSFLSGFTRVPKLLRKEIELLWQLSHNPAKNYESTSNMSTCIATRGENISKLINQFKSKLIQIGMNQNKEAELMEQAQSTLEIQINELNNQLQKGQYTGTNKHLSLNTEITKRYNHNISIESLFDCYLLNHFDPSVVANLLVYNIQLGIKLNEHLSDLDNYIIYLIQTPLGILEHTLPFIIEQHVHSIGAYFSLMTEEKRELIIDNLVEITESFEYLKTIISELDGIYLSKFLASFENLEEFFTSSEQFCDAYDCLDGDELDVFVQYFDKCWPVIVYDGDGFNMIFEKLNPTHQKNLLKGMKNRWPQIIKNIYDFISTLEPLSTSLRNKVINSLNNRWPAIIEYGFEFDDIHYLLNEKQKNIIIKSLEGKWATKIYSCNDLMVLSKYLTNDEMAIVLGELTDEWGRIKERESDLFVSLLINFSPTLQDIVLESLNDQLKDFIKTSHEFANLVFHLNIAQKNKVIHLMRSNLPGIIKTTSDFNNVIVCLSPEQQNQLLISLDTHWFSLMTNEQDVQLILQHLNPIQKNFILKILQDYFFNTILVQHMQGMGTLINSIEFIAYQNSPYIWGIKHLYMGIHQLKFYCPASEIENLLRTIIYNIPEEIESAFNGLTAENPSNRFFFTHPNVDKKMIVMDIIYHYFPSFFIAKLPHQTVSIEEISMPSKKLKTT